MIIEDDSMYYEALQEVDELMVLDNQDDAKLLPVQIERLLRLIAGIEEYENETLGRWN